MNTLFLTTRAEAKAQAKAHLYALLAKEIPILFLSSGGSCLGLLETPLANTRYLTLAVLDERFSTDPKINNYLQLLETSVGQSVTINKSATIPTLPQPNQSLNDFATTYEHQLKTWKQSHPHGLIIATIGMGSDGHIAGIFPFSENESYFNATFAEKLVAGYSVGQKHQFSERITVTPSFLIEYVDEAIVFITGPEKRTKFYELASTDNPIQLPASLLKHMHNVTVYTDFASNESTA